MASSKRIWKILGFPCFILAVLAAVFAFRGQFASALRDREVLRTWILAQGNLAFLAFAALQVLQVVLFVLPGEIIQVAGGYVFGFWSGSALSLLGIGLGSVANFYVGRVLGRPFVEGLFGPERTESLGRLSSSPKAATGFFLFFLIPGIPKDALCYVAGMARLGLPSFLAISSLGRLPGILGSSYMGSAAQRGAFFPALLVLGASSLLFALGLMFRKRIEGAVEGLAKRPKP